MNLRLLVIPITIFVLIGTSGCLQMAASAYDRRMRGEMAPDFELTDLEERTVRLHDFRGQPVVLAFWAYG